MFNSGITAKDLIDELKTEVDIALDIPNSSYVSWLNSVEQLLYSEIIKEQREKYVSDANDILNEFGVEVRRATSFMYPGTSDFVYRTKYEPKNTINVYTYPAVGSGVIKARLYGSPYYVDVANADEYCPIDLIGVSKLFPNFEEVKEGDEISWTFCNDSVERYVEVFVEETIHTDTPIDKPRFEDIYAIYTDNDTQLIKTTLTSGRIIFSNAYYKDGDKVGVSANSNGGYRVIYNVRPALKTVADIANQYVMLPLEFIDLVKAKLRGEAYKLANEDGLAAKWINDYNVLLENFKAWIAAKAPEFGM
mgnify:CR=1 FL=1